MAMYGDNEEDHDDKIEQVGSAVYTGGKEKMKRFPCHNWPRLNDWSDPNRRLEGDLMCCRSIRIPAPEQQRNDCAASQLVFVQINEDRWVRMDVCIDRGFCGG